MNKTLVLMMLLGVSLFVWDYLRCRRKSFEDRYMALYGHNNWDSCNMELRLSFNREKDQAVKNLFTSRLAAHLTESEPQGSLLHEKTRLHRKRIDFYYDAYTTLQELMFPRRGIYLDGGQPGNLNIVWNHIQSDGIRLWRTLRPLFDTNSAILDFNPPKMPPAFLPEILAIPTTIKRVFFRYNLPAPESDELSYGFQKWRTDPIKQIKVQKNIPSFNMVTTALIINELFRQHTDARKLTVGLTVAFTFLDAKNQYGVITLRIKRADFDGICGQIIDQVRGPMRVWGTFATQSYLLSFFPDQLFKKVMNYFRGQLDVLISSLPLGRKPAEINGVPITLSCYPKELTIPYYFLLMGAGPHIHMSFTHKHTVLTDFMDQEKVLSTV